MLSGSFPENKKDLPLALAFSSERRGVPRVNRNNVYKQILV